MKADAFEVVERSGAEVASVLGDGGLVFDSVVLVVKVIKCAGLNWNETRLTSLPAAGGVDSAFRPPAV